MESRDEKIRDGCEVYACAAERAKGGERSISMDELTGVQALERKHPDLPMLPSHVLRREFEYIRHGTLSWFINFDVVDFPDHPTLLGSDAQRGGCPGPSPALDCKFAFSDEVAHHPG